eukprot:TRINITY_DN8346_c0_g1_i1.p1 TRINITY_DN8346_c0_g1~~TRINITY_DN8346_c0_g1_i1.p1  ORF type:complete len:374 (+),score=38.27 TRINITY_DN8346_c0_g1_i1:2-1123(+)
MSEEEAVVGVRLLTGEERSRNLIRLDEVHSYRDSSESSRSGDGDVKTLDFDEDSFNTYDSLRFLTQSMRDISTLDKKIVLEDTEVIMDAFSDYERDTPIISQKLKKTVSLKRLRNRKHENTIRHRSVDSLENITVEKKDEDEAEHSPGNNFLSRMSRQRSSFSGVVFKRMSIVDVSKNEADGKKKYLVLVKRKKVFMGSRVRTVCLQMRLNVQKVYHTGMKCKISLDLNHSLLCSVSVQLFCTEQGSRANLFHSKGRHFSIGEAQEFLLDTSGNITFVMPEARELEAEHFILAMQRGSLYHLKVKVEGKKVHFNMRVGPLKMLPLNWNTNEKRKRKKKRKSPRKSKKSPRKSPRKSPCKSPRSKSPRKFPRTD